MGMLTVDVVLNFGGSSINIEPVSQCSAPLPILLRNPGYFTLAEKSVFHTCRDAEFTFPGLIDEPERKIMADAGQSIINSHRTSIGQSLTTSRPAAKYDGS